ncbi:MAG: DUF4160 domain-containing protein [Terriglobales bacterium]
MLGLQWPRGFAKFGGVRFVVYSNDHPPRHVHGFAGEMQVIVDLRTDGTVGLADRDDAIRPANAKRSDVRKILQVAADHFEELAELWEAIHDGRA